MLLIGQPKVNKVKTFLPFSKFMKRPQTKFHAHTMSESQAIRSKNQNLSLGQNLSFFFLTTQFYLFIDILLKLQQQTLICFCKFSCNSVIIMGLLRILV